MPNITRQDFKTITARVDEEKKKYKSMIMVCTGTGCISAKSFNVRDSLKKEIQSKGIAKDFLVVGTGCYGFCAAGPIVVVQPEGIFYHKVKEKDVAEIVDSHLVHGKPVERLFYKDPASGKLNQKMSEIQFFTKQELLAHRNRGIIDPEKIEDYIARGGYASLAKALESMSPDDVVKEVMTAGIRGRGGAGFPTALKWQSCKKAMSERKEIAYIVCNGAFMDRSIIESDPHSVIEGMIIGAYAIGAKQGFIYLRKEYPVAVERMKKAIEDAKKYGFLGTDILGKGMTFDIKIHQGAAAFVCGESTALMESMSGRAGEPRAKYVHNAEYGYKDKPTVLNNVETWANIPIIVEKGGKWFASIGTGDVGQSPWGGSKGTKVFSLAGNVNNMGIIEVPMGITLREIVFDIGGGIPKGRKFKAAQIGGPSGGCIPEKLLDMKIDYDSLTQAGAMIGSGGITIMDEKTCMVDVARYFTTFLSEESCGKCTACREGLYALSNTLTKICNGQGQKGDLEFIEELAKTISETSLCQLGITAANPVLSTIRYFKDEYEKHIDEKKCPGGVCKSLISYSIGKKCIGCQACAKACPTKAISGQAKKMHVIAPEKCVKCGVCYETCKFDAVEVK